ncbi:MAG TPA: hypothetical protein VFU94_05135 [Conexibacter sp.]|nr:hypothetical protein [Conexibacter sp.]
MPEPLARLYDLALRALDEHERRIAALRGRLGPVLAAAALGASLLSGPAIGGRQPATVGGKLAVALAVAGLLVTIAGAFRVLGMRRQPVEQIDPRRLSAELDDEGLLADEVDFYDAMILRLGEHVDRDAATVEKLATSFTAMLWGILVMLCGLTFAAIVG